MSLTRLRRFGFAAWLVAVALIANAAAQNQLALNVVEAATEQAAQPPAPADPHAHHDHAQHMAAMATAAQTQAHAAHQHHSDAGGHTHKGHADCAVCGVVAVMAGLTLPAAIAFDIPRDFVRPGNVVSASAARIARRYERYISRAPPRSI